MISSLGARLGGVLPEAEPGRSDKYVAHVVAYHNLAGIPRHTSMRSVVRSLNTHNTMAEDSELRSGSWCTLRQLTADTFEALLDLLRRLPPTRAEANIEALCQLAPEYADDLLGNVDQPLKVLHDEQSGKDFLGCDYNRDGDSFRSPWTDEYIPPAPGAPQPSPRLRQLEASLNTAFETYREMYFEGGTSSVYLWDLDEDPATAKDMQFAGVVLMKKSKSRPWRSLASKWVPKLTTSPPERPLFWLLGLAARVRVRRARPSG